MSLSDFAPNMLDGQFGERLPTKVLTGLPGQELA
jgi:hypothetical protein